MTIYLMTMAYVKERIKTELLGSILHACAFAFVIAIFGRMNRIGRDDMRKEKVAWLLLVILLLGCATMQHTSIASSTSGTTIYVEPPTSSALIGETFNVDIAVTDVTNLYGWNILIHFDPTILDATSVARGPFLEQAGSTSWQMWEILHPGEPREVINNTAGYVIAGDALAPPLPGAGASGGGTLVSITFLVEAEGATSLSFYEELTKLTTVIGSVTVPIPHDTVDGFFNNLSPATPPDTNASRARIRDVAVTYVKAHPLAVPQGEPVYLNVTVENQGSKTETFNVTVSARRHSSNVVILVGTQTVCDLPPEASEILNFVWDTTDAPFGSYDVISEAILPKDDDPEDNIFKLVVGGICVPDQELQTNPFSYIIKIAPTILAIVGLGMAGLGFIKILGSERLGWPIHLLDRGT